MKTDDNSKKYFRFSDNGRIFMITDIDSSQLNQTITDSFNNAVKFFLIILSALKKAGKSAFDYEALQKIFEGRNETVLNKKEEKSVRPGENNFNKLNEVIINYATDGLPVKDSNLTIAKNILNVIRSEMYTEAVVNKLNKKIAYPILYLEAYANTVAISFKIYYIQSNEIEKLKISYQDGDCITKWKYEDCNYFAYRGNFDYSIDIYDFISLNSKNHADTKDFTKPIKL